MINRLFQEAIMKPSTRLYACLKLLAILHIVEQLIFGMQDLRQLQYLIAIYERRFGDTSGSIGALVTISASLASIAVHCILKGGLARFVTMFVLGLPTLGEFHHLVESMTVGHYTAGTVTVRCLRRAVPESPSERVFPV